MQTGLLVVGGSAKPESGSARIFVGRDEAGSAAGSAASLFVQDGDDEGRKGRALLAVADQLDLAISHTAEGPLLDKVTVVLGQSEIGSCTSEALWKQARAERRRRPSYLGLVHRDTFITRRDFGEGLGGEAVGATGNDALEAGAALSRPGAHGARLPNNDISQLRGGIGSQREANKDQSDGQTERQHGAVAVGTPGKEGLTFQEARPKIWVRSGGTRRMPSRPSMADILGFEHYDRLLKGERQDEVMRSCVVGISGACWEGAEAVESLCPGDWFRPRVLTLLRRVWLAHTSSQLGVVNRGR